MCIQSLAWIGLNVSDLDPWRSYAEDLGAMVVPSGPDGFGIRIDERPFRVLVAKSADPRPLAFAGWQVEDAGAITAIRAKLEAAGHPVRPATPEECEARRVRGMIHATDPAGFAVEIFHGPLCTHERFVSSTGLSGFVTGELGLGHIVLGVPDAAASFRFYTEVLGFRVSDFMKAGDGEVAFLHCNPRHHSLALVPADEPALYHFMLEVRSLDDVGYTLDRHQTQGIPLARGLGKHMNDQMVSFYSRSPSGVEVEFGWGGLQIDDDHWSVGEIARPSFWGHHPV